MSILYKNARNVRFVLFIKNSNDFETRIPDRWHPDTKLERRFYIFVVLFSQALTLEPTLFGVATPLVMLVAAILSVSFADSTSVRNCKVFLSLI